MPDTRNAVGGEFILTQLPSRSGGALLPGSSVRSIRRRQLDDHIQPKSSSAWANLSGETLVYLDNNLSTMSHAENLEVLLRHRESVLKELVPEDVVPRRQRQLWLVLVVVALVWGCLTGLAIGVSHFFLAVPPAFLGSGGILVLAATLWTMGRGHK